MITRRRNKPSISSPHSSFVVGFRRPHQASQARLARPAGDGFKQPAADAGSVHRLEEAEEGGWLLGRVVMIAIDVPAIGPRRARRAGHQSCMTACSNSGLAS